MSSKICPWCKGIVLLDLERGEAICSKCGRVVETNVREGQFNPWRTNKYDRLGGVMGP